MARPRSRRQRRTAEEARTAIFDATERRLIAAGLEAPSGWRRWRPMSASSHPTVLHHFGSRERLVQAVVLRALAALEADVLEAITEAPRDHSHFGPLLERVFAAFDARGHGRALAWLALAGMTQRGTDPRLRAVVDATHARRLAGVTSRGLTKKHSLKTLCFTSNFINLSVIRTIGDGPSALQRARAERRRRRTGALSRTWLAALLLARLGSAP